MKQIINKLLSIFRKGEPETPSEPEAPKYPEHEKLRSLSRERDGAQMLYDYLGAEGLVIAGEHTDTIHCDLYEAFRTPQDLIGGALGIDSYKLEEEKMFMLEELRSTHKE